MSEGHPSPPLELWDMDIPGFRVVPLVPAPGTASGYKRVKKVNSKTYQACRTVGGKQRHVWTSDDPRECAYVLARLELEPLSEEEIKTACKAAAKDRVKCRAFKRKEEQFRRREERARRYIDRLWDELVVAPKEAAARARMDQGACVERVPLSPVKNGAL